jgi:hypothetical protein
MTPISIKVLRSSALTGVSLVRLPLISRNTQRRWIAVSRLKPAHGEFGWSVIGVSFLCLQPQFDQAADGFGSIQFHSLTRDPFVN